MDILGIEPVIYDPKYKTLTLKVSKLISEL